jgi:hypothetical protein
MFFTALVFVSAQVFIAGMNRKNTAMTIASLVMGGFPTAAIIMQIRYLRGMISEFTLDQGELRFRTLGRSVNFTRHRQDVAGIHKWRSRGGGMGLTISFRNGDRATLDLALPRAIELEGWLHGTSAGD